MTVSLQVSYSTDGHDVVFEVFGLDPSQTATLTFTDSTKSQIASFNVTPGDNGVALQADLGHGFAGQVTPLLLVADSGGSSFAIAGNPSPPPAPISLVIENGSVLEPIDVQESHHVLVTVSGLPGVEPLTFTGSNGLQLTENVNNGSFFFDLSALGAGRITSFAQGTTGNFLLSPGATGNSIVVEP